MAALKNLRFLCCCLVAYVTAASATICLGQQADTSQSYANGLLWEVVKPGAADASWIFATSHSGDLATFEFGDVVLEKLAQAQRYAPYLCMPEA